MRKGLSWFGGAAGRSRISNRFRGSAFVRSRARANTRLQATALRAPLRCALALRLNRHVSPRCPGQRRRPEMEGNDSAIRKNQLRRTAPRHPGARPGDPRRRQGAIIGKPQPHAAKQVGWAVEQAAQGQEHSSAISPIGSAHPLARVGSVRYELSANTSTWQAAQHSSELCPEGHRDKLKAARWAGRAPGLLVGERAASQATSNLCVKAFMVQRRGGMVQASKAVFMAQDSSGQERGLTTACTRLGLRARSARASGQASEAER